MQWFDVDISGIHKNWWYPLLDKPEFTKWKPMYIMEDTLSHMCTSWKRYNWECSERPLWGDTGVEFDRSYISSVVKSPNSFTIKVKWICDKRRWFFHCLFHWRNNGFKPPKRTCITSKCGCIPIVLELMTSNPLLPVANECLHIMVQPCCPKFLWADSKCDDTNQQHSSPSAPKLARFFYWAVVRSIEQLIHSWTTKCGSQGLGRTVGWRALLT